MEEFFATFARRGDDVDLRFERYYPRRIETVWAALTEAERLADWLAPALVEPRVGGRYELFTNRPRPMTGRIRVFEPPHRLEYSWDTGDAPETIVRCELATEGEGTRLVFQHFGVGHGWIALVLPGWHQLLDRLADLLAGKTQDPSMERWRELQ